MLEKYRLPIALGLIIVVIAASGILLWQKQDLTSDWQKEKTALEVAINNINKENQDLKNKIGQLEQSIQSTNVEQIKSTTNKEIGQVKSASSSSAQATEDSSAKSGLININTANAKTLEQLPGVGPTRAQQIIDYRTSNGPFQKPEDIMQIKGIGQATYEKMKEMITVE